MAGRTAVGARRRGRARRPRPVVPGGGRAPRCSSSRAVAAGSSPVPGTPGARRRRPASWRSGARSSVSRPRSRAWSASWSGSAPARARARRSRGSRSSTRSTGSTAAPPIGRTLEFAFKAPERSGRVVFELEDATLTARDKHCCSTAPSCGWSAASTSSLVGPNGVGKTTLIDAAGGARRELGGGQAAHAATTSSSGYLSQHAEELGRHGAARCSRRPSARPG